MTPDLTPLDRAVQELDRAGERALDWILSTVDGVEAQVDALRRARPAATPEELAATLVSRAAWRAALYGGATSIPSAVALAAWPLVLAQVGIDVVLTLREDLAMLLELAYLYGPHWSDWDRREKALGVLVAMHTPPGLDRDVGQAALLAASQVGAKHLAIRILRWVLRRRLQQKSVWLLPVFQACAINYWTTRALGDYARVWLARSAVRR